jgi:stage V sporulation protein K
VKIKIWNNQQTVVDAGGKKEVGNVKKNHSVQSTGRKFSAGEETGLQKNAREIMSELYALIGLFSVKKLIEEIYAFVEIQKLRNKEKLATEPLVLHMIFKGNPGTGKTTVARILGKLFKEVGVLPRGHLIEVERADLVGEFIGHTAHKTREQVKKAFGGILFIDEAYSLARGGEKDFGKEAIDALVNTKG